MNLQLLVSSLNYSCSLALAHHRGGTLGPRAALAVGFDNHGQAQILFVADSHGAQCPALIQYGAIFLSECLVSVTDAVAGLGLEPDKAVERMVTVLLPNLAHLAYRTQLSDPRLINFATLLDQFAVNGIVAGIAAMDKPAAQKPAVATCKHPERN